MKFTAYVENLLKEKIKKQGIRKIGFIEGGSKRMKEAALRLQRAGLVKPVMLFATKTKYQESNLHQELKYLIIEEEKELFEKVSKYYIEKRSFKEKPEDLKKTLKQTPYFGAALVAIGQLNGSIGGVHFSSSDILRSAFKVIGPKKDVKTISSVMIMHRNDDSYIFSDISVNIKPNSDQLVDIAKNACDFAKSLDIKRKVAFLSFSTSGSASNSDSIKIKEATNKFNKLKYTTYKAIGEIQFDAAYDTNIRSMKYKDKEGFKKTATILVFPDLNAANIGYKIAQRMGDWGAIGPILTGIAKPANDLSRGATILDIEYTAILTALQSF